MLTHPCDACGDTVPVCDLCHEPMLYQEFDADGPCEQWACFCNGGNYVEACPVCLGAGSFPDRMPAADALADAETFSRNLPWIPFISVDRSVKHSGVETLYRMSRRAARAAFRAVPGLREES